ncbi:hypothetical protein BMETH_3395198483, partial [methanotrophic bacterial endosymbiont of Bathymodiolus sp.]
LKNHLDLRQNRPDRAKYMTVTQNYLHLPLPG